MTKIFAAEPDFQVKTRAVNALALQFFDIVPMKPFLSAKMKHLFHSMSYVRMT